MIFCFVFQAQQGQKSGTSRGKNSVPRHGCIALNLIFTISPPTGGSGVRGSSRKATATASSGALAGQPYGYSHTGFGPQGRSFIYTESLYVYDYEPPPLNCHDMLTLPCQCVNPWGVFGTSTFPHLSGVGVS
eukprot:scaffold5387_cov141-Isochrysis_galbana.AAC.1